MSVDDRPASTTEAPRCRAPSAKARARPGPVSRMSCAVTILAAQVTSTHAAPIARAIVSSSWSGTVPRTSYALTRAERSTINPRFARLIGAGSIGAGSIAARLIGAGLIDQARTRWFARSQSHPTEVRGSSGGGRHNPVVPLAFPRALVDFRPGNQPLVGGSGSVPTRFAAAHPPGGRDAAGRRTARPAASPERWLISVPEINQSS